METPKHGDGEKIETGEKRAWTSASWKQAGEPVVMIRGTAVTSLLMDCASDEQRFYLKKKKKARVSLQERDRKREDDGGDARRECFTKPWGSMLTYTATSLSSPH